MKFSNEKPPIWDKLSKTFNVEWGGNLVVAYKDTIYHSKPLSDDLIVHESIHLSRQKNPDEWWSRYLNDSKFRLGEELLAYRAQYVFLKKNIKDRNLLFRHLLRIASDLSSPMYNLPITQTEALKMIKME